MSSARSYVRAARETWTSRFALSRAVLPICSVRAAGRRLEPVSGFEPEPSRLQDGCSSNRAARAVHVADSTCVGVSCLASAIFVFLQSPCPDSNRILPLTRRVLLLLSCAGKCSRCARRRQRETGARRREQQKGFFVRVQKPGLFRLAFETSAFTS